MEQGQKKPFNNRTGTGQRGQALVEYILLLVIIFSLAMGMKKGFRSLNDKMSNYMGQYIACLMDYGELPSLGVQNPALNKHSPLGGSGRTCDAQFSGFTFENGRNPSGTGGGVGGGSGSGTSGGTSGSASGAGGNGSKNSSSNASNDGNGNGSGSDSSSGSEGNPFGGGRNGGSKKSSYGNGSLARSSSGYGTSDGGFDTSASSASKVKILQDDDAESKKSRDRNSRKSYYRPNQYVYNSDKYRALTGAEAEDLEKTIARKPRVPSSRAIATPLDEGGMRLGPYKRTFTPPEAKTAEIREDGESGFSFGYMMRWLLIAGIVVAIVVFFGGQIMNYSNSQE